MTVTFAGKTCTAYPTLEYDVTGCGGVWTAPNPIDLAVVDGTLITAAAWPGHPAFIARFIEALGTTITIG
jgi:putative intracellular protease/amidase